MFFARVEVRGWKSLRKVKDGETADDLFAFLTCSPNAEVKAVDPKAMPVILSGPDDRASWMEGALAEDLQLRLPDGALRLVEEAI
ncbi:hypothetical protein [Paracoccus xiamenensis]|uniref:hypothetical protein n=1 Tax=Paracoccus xiamenensis TaxID=2714901 RepID=UPI001F34DCE0|nr:hypothetical protein [Paracoccus xiamenensis]